MSSSTAHNDKSNQSPHDHAPKPDQVRIIVNDQPVVLNGPHQTGASIKQAAISQGVPIQPDFVLSEIRPNGHQKVIPDDARVTLKDGDEFWAIPGDDNS
ncbi:MAG: hypothetical protein DLM57_11510 [Pseudonocardiales bacterium]|nr:MAG: hypothetical protein DLM57_11510 [Pseudonocardiales bacterium]